MNPFVNRGDKPTKTGFGEGLLEAGLHDERVVCLGSDITASVGCNLFAEALPHRFITLGIAEQNAVGVAAGLALEGKIPVFATYGVFAAMRTADHIRVSLCYNNLHAVIGGAHAGVSVGPDGATQARLATLAAIRECRGPVYIRFGREAMPDFTLPGQEFRIGRAQVLREGRDLAVIATGHMTWEALLAAEILAERGIGCRVVNLHTVKPIDHEAIVAAAVETGAILTAEEHQVAGGMGSAVAEVVAARHPVPMAFTGMHDRFGESGRPRELMQKFGMTAEAIAKEALDLLARKR